MEVDRDIRYTPTGVRRAGDDYQDIIGLEQIVEWLEHPSRFLSMEVEADDAGYLDDIVISLRDGTRIFRQVKFSAHPNGQRSPIAVSFSTPI